MGRGAIFWDFHRFFAEMLCSRPFLRRLSELTGSPTLQKVTDCHDSRGSGGSTKRPSEPPGVRYVSYTLRHEQRALAEHLWLTAVRRRCRGPLWTTWTASWPAIVLGRAHSSVHSSGSTQAPRGCFALGSIPPWPTWYRSCRGAPPPPAPGCPARDLRKETERGGEQQEIRGT